jgi:hypothetical protein
MNLNNRLRGLSRDMLSRSHRATTVVTSILALGMLGSAGLAAAASAPAQASSGPYMNTSWWMDVSPGGTPEYYLTKGTPVEMVCWTRGPSADGTQKWFYVGDENYPYPFGYVPANAVSNQISTPLCG